MTETIVLLLLLARAASLAVVVAQHTEMEAGTNAASLPRGHPPPSDGTDMVSVKWRLEDGRDGRPGALLIAVQGLVPGAGCFVDVQLQRLPTLALEFAYRGHLTATHERGNADVALTLPPDLTGPHRLLVDVYDFPESAQKACVIVTATDTQLVCTDLPPCDCYRPDALLARASKDGIEILERPPPGGDGGLHGDIARFVQSMLMSWADVKVEHVRVQDVSGAGGQKTYRVAHGSKAVAFSSRESGTMHESSRSRSCLSAGVVSAAVVSRQELSFCAVVERQLLLRLSKASSMLAAQKIAPVRLAEGETWHITEWLQRGSLYGLGVALEVKTVAAIGSVLARLHSIDTIWFNEFRTRNLEQYPELSNADGSIEVSADGRYSWCAPQGGMDGPMDGPILAQLPYVRVHIPYMYPGLQPVYVCPRHPVAARLVTSHGDFHLGNVVVAGQQGAREDDVDLRLIDFDFISVGMAVRDLVSMTTALGDAEPRMKRVFLEAYLRGLGEPVEASSLDDLVLDCELGKLAQVLLRCCHRVQQNAVALPSC